MTTTEKAKRLAEELERYASQRENRSNSPRYVPFDALDSAAALLREMASENAKLRTVVERAAMFPVTAILNACEHRTPKRGDPLHFYGYDDAYECIGTLARAALATEEDTPHDE